jgi:hypothetical protein
MKIDNGRKVAIIGVSLARLDKAHGVFCATYNHCRQRADLSLGRIGISRAKVSPDPFGLRSAFCVIRVSEVWRAMKPSRVVSCSPARLRHPALLFPKEAIYG